MKLELIIISPQYLVYAPSHNYVAIRGKTMLLHLLKSLPTDIPFAVLREAGIGDLWASVPSGAHHCHGAEQGSVARKIDAQTLGFLEVVTIYQIGVLLTGSEQCLHSSLSVAKACGAHGYHAVVPSPCGCPVPVGVDPAEGSEHGGRSVEGFEG